MTVNKMASAKKIKSYELLVRSLHAKKESLKHLLQEAYMSRPGSQRRKGSGVLSSLDLKYLMGAFKVLSAGSKPCERVTSKLCPFAECTEKRWSCRAHIVEKDRDMVSSRLMVAPYQTDAKVLSAMYFKASFDNEVEFTERIMTEEALKECWNDVSPTVLEKSSCICAVPAESKIPVTDCQAMQTSSAY